MEFIAPPLHSSGFGPFFLDSRTIYVMVTLTFLVQAVVILFHSRLEIRYQGIRMFLASALFLALGSGLLILIPWVHPREIGLPSSLLMLWGTALQYTALARFTGLKPSRGLLLTLNLGGTIMLSAMFLVQGPTPFVAVREILTAPLLFAAALLLRRADVRKYWLGAIITALPFAGYGCLSILRVVRGIVDPSQMQPGPNLSNDIDALLYFTFSFLWTSGFLLMVNQRLQSELLAQASHDPLTGCLNRRAMANLLEHEQHRFLRYGRPFTVILLDLDRFKTINDTRGHHTGDHVLVRTAEVLRGALRTGDSLARWGGEEFLILLPETHEADGAALAERLRLQIAGHAFDLEGLDVTFSAGVAGARADQSVDELCLRADRALYVAKETRNRVVTDGEPGEAHSPIVLP